MARFSYLDGKKLKKAARDQAAGDALEPVEVVYIRREIIRAAWRAHKDAGGESVSELVEDLLLEWLARQR
ncbi:hypothetical protein ACFP81_03225 [Deinococcus lacus]|uniref:CopG family transcriptional regulator n=1 Tax=Deinococcus lacus TaxID=392561 RepID=A0ABW1YA01_9DEIO